MSRVDAALVLALAAMLGVVIPWMSMSMLAPSLLDRPGAGVRNYRGLTVSPGLGVVWFVWAGCAVVGGVAAAGLDADTLLPLLIVAGPLALMAFAAGVIDDAYGSADAKGFRGHLKAMAAGRLTTGGVKLLSVGFTSLAAAAVVGIVAPWNPVAPGSGNLPSLEYLVGSLFAGAGIALTANFLNLMDLRPGRALKGYVALSAFGMVCLATSGTVAERIGAGTAERLFGAAGLLLFALGPVLSVWRFDLGERGMLGDAGANPMGAVAGLLMVAGLPLWGVVAYAAVMAALNAASERVSFSKVIEATPWLAWVDALGRSAEAGPAKDESHEGPAAE